MFTIEKLKNEDFPAAINLANTMNWNMTTADFEFNKKLEPNGCFALKEKSKIVGIATCISFGKVGWFGNLIVEEKQRKQGAGTRLVKHSTNYLNSIGVTTIGLYAYPHLVDFYSRIGFKRDKDFIYLKAQINISGQAHKGKSNLKKPRQTDFPKIIDLDAKCFGTSRKKLLQPILKDKETVCLLDKREGNILGFALANAYNDSAEVGPLVCNKTDADVAKELLAAILHNLTSAEVYMCFPTSETELLELASSLGFKEEFKVTRMFLGPSIQTDCVYIAESLERG